MRVILWCLQYGVTHYSESATTRDFTNTHFWSAKPDEHCEGRADDGATLKNGRPFEDASCQQYVVVTERYN
jgi:hypothetical protein